MTNESEEFSTFMSCEDNRVENNIETVDYAVEGVENVVGEQHEGIVDSIPATLKDTKQKINTTTN